MSDIRPVLAPNLWAAAPPAGIVTVEHDYYQILGVPPAASPNDIRNAYRRKAMLNHPDRGGSHAAMVLVQEAWDVLSDDGRRARYDAARTAASSVTSRKAAAQDAREARWRAEQYPRGWAEMEAVLNRVAADFTGAEHGSVNLGHDFRFPTAGKSVSGWVFILVGAALGGVFVSPLVYGLAEGVAMKAPKGPFIGLCMLIAVALPVLGGAWVGAVAHKWIGDTFKGDRGGRCPNPGCNSLQGWEGGRCRYCGTTADASPSPEPSSGAGSGATTAVAPPPASSETRIVGCEKCGQRLRLPALSAELDVTCTNCRHKFSCKPPA